MVLCKIFQVPLYSTTNLLESTPLMNLSKQKYLEIIIDSNQTWVCLQKDGILYILIGCHQKVLPNNTIKMLLDSLLFSHYVWPSCLGP